MDIDSSRNLHGIGSLVDGGGFDELFERIAKFVATDPDLDAKAERERDARVALEQAEEAYHILIASGCPKMAVLALNSITVADGEWKEARGRLSSFCRVPGAIVSLNGPCGTGKTVMSVSVARGLVRLGRSVRYAKAYDYCRDLREAQREADIERAFKRPTYLVLDEFHELKNSQFSQGAIDRLVDARHQAGKITVIVSNIPPALIESCLGASITSRMHMTGGVIACEWASFRER